MDARLAVVVHAAPQADADALALSRQLAVVLAARLTDASGRELEAHGVGALVPSVLGAAGLRVEIVELESGTP